MIQNVLPAPICRGLDEGEVAEILAVAESVELPRGASLFRDGEPGGGMYVVIEGEVEVVKESDGGRRQPLARVGPGGVVGEMSLLGGVAHRSASAVAASDARLLRLPAERFRALLDQENVAALKVVHNLARVLCQRIQKMNERLLGGPDVRGRTEELAEFERILTRWSF